MSGSLFLTTPWAKRYFDADQRAAVEELIPDGHALLVGAKTKPGEWTLRLRHDYEEVHRATVYGKDLAWLCRSTLNRWAAQ